MADELISVKTSEDEARELAFQAQEKHNQAMRERVTKCQEEIHAVLEKYNCNLRIAQTIEAVPAQNPRQ